MNKVKKVQTDELYIHPPVTNYIRKNSMRQNKLINLHERSFESKLVKQDLQYEW